ncbi:Uric acid-xanthine permease [Tolypocladium ophioglossoides CBS 100239]|uniref:Uric acid-xanthine permease n=1 Tax=Tolypocladium ophioglossoides (strain CBS 100239) TaxID=1163406 RepID=A0A0L0NHI8_TOLOC|nr:Uric acid-xanthine permease [Tolypocladium ophioglossoides CBS 100239]
MDEDSGPSSITRVHSSRQGLGARLRSFVRAFTTRDGLIGDYDYAFLFRPNLPFLSGGGRSSPFFGLNDRMPVVLAVLLGLQHALAMLAGVITPPIILGGSGGANLEPAQQQYLVSTALVVSGLLSSVQIRRFRIPKTRYFVGTGLLSVVGISFSIIPVAQGAFRQMYASGYCPSDGGGNPLPCPRGYGALVGTAGVCALVEALISFLPPRVLLRMFPPIVTGPTVMLIGVHLVQSGFKDWMGGSGPCADPAGAGAQRALFAACPAVGAPHALPWGSAEFLGLGFAVFATIVLCERFGSPLMKSTSVVLGLLVGCVVAAACGYFDAAGIAAAPVASFPWVQTFPLSVYGPLVLPVAAVFVVCATEAVGDITATCDVSRLDVAGRAYESRIQGGLLADGLNGVAAALMTMTPMSRFAQNNGVIALTRCANRTAGLACCLFLVVMGVFAKFAAALVAIPKPVLGGMTTFLFAAVAVSGMAILFRGVPFNRRTRFILTAGLSLGYGATLVPNYFEAVFTYGGGNHALQGFLNAIVLVMETGFAVTAAVCMALDLMLPVEMEEDLDARSVELAAVDTASPTKEDARDGGDETNTRSPEADPGSHQWGS